ncbi:MAG: hypothetical protein SGI74_00405 [Oligoflexia bacterium]|nr:hypothetical protein [Oligoflexia bacterium]
MEIKPNEIQEDINIQEKALKISHDINNILGPIVLSVEILKLQIHDKKLIAKLDVVDNGIKSLNAQIKELFLLFK